MKTNFLGKKAVLTVATLLVAVSAVLCAALLSDAPKTTNANADFYMLSPELYFNEEDTSVNGVSFTAELGDNYSADAEYHMLIVPMDYVLACTLGGNYGDDVVAAIKDKTSDYIDFVCEPYEAENAYYIRGSLVSVKFDNINLDWYGIAYRVSGEERVYAEIKEENGNIANIPYLASKALNEGMTDGEEAEVLKTFVADAFDKASGNQKGTTDYTSLTDLFDLSALSCAPNKITDWTPALPDGLSLAVSYSAEDEDYAYAYGGSIYAVKGDGNKETTKKVTAKVLGKTYERAVHVYEIETTITSERDVLCVTDALIDGEQYYSYAQLYGAKIDGDDDISEIASVKWIATTGGVTFTDDGVVRCNFRDIFEERYFYVYYRCNIGGVNFTSPMKKFKAVYPKSSDTSLVLKYAKSVATSYDLTAEAILGEDTEEVIKGVYDSEDLTENLYADGKVNVASVGMGDRLFTVKTDISIYTVRAIVADVIIKNADDLTAFLALRAGANNDGATKYNYGWDDKNADGVVDSGERIYYALGDDITYGQMSAAAYRSSMVSKLLDDCKDIGFLGVFDGCGFTITASDVRNGGLFGDLGYGSVVKNLGCKFTTVKAASGKCVLFARVMWGATIDNCYIDYMQTHTSADYVGLSAAAKECTMSNTVIYAYQMSSNNTAIVTSYASGGRNSIATQNVIMIYRSDNQNFSVRGGTTWDDSISGLYKIDGTGEYSLSYDYGQAKLTITKTIDGTTTTFSSFGYNTKYFDTETACGIPKWKGI